MERKKRLDKAAKELAALLEAHFDGLSPREREAKSSAFHEAVAKVGTRAKSAEPPKTQGSRRAVRRHE
jgi:hypothetical protein